MFQVTEIPGAVCHTALIWQELGHLPLPGLGEGGACSELSTPPRLHPWKEAMEARLPEGGGMDTGKAETNNISHHAGANSCSQTGQQGLAC